MERVLARPTKVSTNATTLRCAAARRSPRMTIRPAFRSTDDRMKSGYSVWQQNYRHLGDDGAKRVKQRVAPSPLPREERHSRRGVPHRVQHGELVRCLCEKSSPACACAACLECQIIQSRPALRGLPVATFGRRLCIACLFAADATLVLYPAIEASGIAHERAHRPQAPSTRDAATESCTFTFDTLRRIHSSGLLASTSTRALLYWGAY